MMVSVRRACGKAANVTYATGLLVALATGAHGLDQLTFTTPGADSALGDDLRAASLLLAAERDGTTSAQDLFAAARAEYGRLLGTLYAQGHYSGVISIRLDGREAAAIAPLNAPVKISQILVSVDPGPAFAFGAAQIAPLARETTLPGTFATGAPAESGVVQQAVEAAVDGWRADGHAKAIPSEQNITADHARARLDVSVTMDPGPQLRFGDLSVGGQQRTREARIREIAGFPTGEVFAPKKLSRTANRLRRSGVFRSVALTEAEAPNPDDTLDVDLQLVEEKTRRYGVGAEITSFEGLNLTGYWLHRNLFGGAERLTVDGEISNVAAQNSGMDYRLGVTIERPATFTADTTVRLSAEFARLDDVDQLLNDARFGFGATQYFSDTLTGNMALDYNYTEVTDIAGTTTFRNLSLPVGLTWDRRDVPLNASQGFYVDAEAMPFLGFGATESGARLTADARAYYSVGSGRPFVFAGRVQGGAIFGATLAGTPRDYLFYSGGGGTVRGQPYQSLGVDILPGGQKTGGTLFVASSLEVRKMVTEKIGVVGFYDVGYVGVQEDTSVGDWHSGAGFGLRYDTGFGPIRFDVATPVSGETGSGVQFYVGIGQAF